MIYIVNITQPGDEATLLYASYRRSIDSFQMQDYIHVHVLLETSLTRALKCKPSAGDMIIKKPED